MDPPAADGGGGGGNGDGGGIGGAGGDATGKKPEPNTQRVPLCKPGDVLKGKWKIVRQIGMGAFGEIYLGRNMTTEERVAVKVEPIDMERQALRTEVSILRKLQECPYVGRFIACGRQDKINYLVMQLLGESLSELRKRQPKNMFTMPTVCRLAIDIVLAIQSIHDLGILHRDVKPSNFVLDKPVDDLDYSVRK